MINRGIIVSSKAAANGNISRHSSSYSSDHTYKASSKASISNCTCYTIFILLLLILSSISLVFMLHHTSLTSTATTSFIISTEDVMLSSIKSFVRIRHNLTDTLSSISKNLQSQSTQHLQLHSSSTKSNLPKQRPRLAYVITITKDGFFQDGAAVLLYSIIKYSEITRLSYDISFIAFVHPTVQSSRKGLEQLGFHVIEVPTPVNTSAIKHKFLREHIDKNGCCGAAELIKLTSYLLYDYHRVIHLDADTLFLNPIDELFARNYSLIYTTDPNMATFKGIDKMPVQGGFIILQPSYHDYKNLINIVMNIEFGSGTGWNRSKIGWFWGGMTVQGVLPYYYNRLTTSNRSQIIDRCYYNTMADSDDCIQKKVIELKSAHFTVCQKPWKCYRAYVNTLCGELHKRWFQLRQEAEEFYNISYHIKDPQRSSCGKGGPMNYRMMDLSNVIIPHDRIPFVIPDHSPDFYAPIQEAGYIMGSTYN